MSNTRLGERDVLAGIAFAAFGAAALALGHDLDVGSAIEMGEGYVPLAMAAALVALGTLIALTAWLRRPAERSGVERVRWRPLAFVTAAILVFAAALEPLGLITAIAASAATANFAGEPLPARSLAVLVAVLSLGATAVFLWGLGLPVHALPRFGG